MATSSANPTFKYLNTRWDVRAARLPVEAGRGLVVLPEAVTLAEFLWNLEWRRHVAMAERKFRTRPVLPACRPSPRATRRLRPHDRLGPSHRPTQEMGHRAPQTAHTDPGRILEPGS